MTRAAPAIGTRPRHLRVAFAPALQGHSSLDHRDQLSACDFQRVRNPEQQGQRGLSLAALQLAVVRPINVCK